MSTTLSKNDSNEESGCHRDQSCQAPINCRTCLGVVGEPLSELHPT